MNRTLILQYLSQCYLSPFSHAWPAKPSYLLSSKVSVSSTISGSPFPLHYAGLLHLSHQVLHDAISATEFAIYLYDSLIAIPNLITRYLPPHRLFQPVFPAPSRLSTLDRPS